MDLHKPTERQMIMDDGLIRYVCHSFVIALHVLFRFFGIDALEWRARDNHVLRQLDGAGDGCPSVTLAQRRRNDALIDGWSGVHLMTGVAMGWVMEPFIALLILVLWEPLENLVLSPLMMKWFKIEFGYETIRNSLSDILFDAVGVAIGFWALRALVDPPFVLF